jgi:hypothetical protein
MSLSFTFLPLISFLLTRTTHQMLESFAKLMWSITLVLSLNSALIPHAPQLAHELCSQYASFLPPEFRLEGPCRGSIARPPSPLNVSPAIREASLLEQNGSSNKAQTNPRKEDFSKPGIQREKYAGIYSTRRRTMQRRTRQHHRSDKDPIGYWKENGFDLSKAKKTRSKAPNQSHRILHSGKPLLQLEGRMTTKRQIHYSVIYIWDRGTEPHSTLARASGGEEGSPGQWYVDTASRRKTFRVLSREKHKSTVLHSHSIPTSEASTFQMK